MIGTLKLSSLFTIYTNNEAVSHSFLSLCEQMHGPKLQTRMVVPNCSPSCRRPNLQEAIPRILKPLCYRSANAPRAITEKRFLQDLENFDAAYIWPDTSLSTIKAIKKRGIPIILERINCYQGKAKRILDDAYKRLGLNPRHLIKFEDILQEDTETDLADYIFCPSPEVKKSFKESGVPEHKLILTSYGWSPERFPNRTSPKLPKEEVTVLFVGKLCVRKGVHLLLRAWEKAGVKGKLVLCGKMEPEIVETCGDILGRSDVVHLEHNHDISFAYREADIFAFPSLEEGGPMVTYEAMAHGLPVIASPMGAGSIMRDGIDGLIVEPYDQDGWVEALRKLAHSPSLRFYCGATARNRAAEFTWEKVGRRRAQALVNKLSRTLVTAGN
jgi:glycosyltransferase involved in cell wall biosynthesis